MKRFAVLGSSLLLVAQIAFANDVLTVVPGSQTCEGVNIPKAATLNLPDRQLGMTTVGFGLRQKKVAFIPVKVYCASVLVSEPASFVRSAANDAALVSLDKMQANAIRLDFVRTVDAATVKSSFAEALTANKVDLNSTNVKAFLNAVATGGDAQSGKALTIAGNEKTGVVLYEDTNGKIQQVQGDAKLVHDVFSIWFGVPADDGIAALKSELIGQ